MKNESQQTMEMCQLVLEELSKKGGYVAQMREEIASKIAKKLGDSTDTDDEDEEEPWYGRVMRKLNLNRQARESKEEEKNKIEGATKSIIALAEALLLLAWGKECEQQILEQREKVFECGIAALGAKSRTDFELAEDMMFEYSNGIQNTQSYAGKVKREIAPYKEVVFINNRWLNEVVKAMKKLCDEVDVLAENEADIKKSVRGMLRKVAKAKEERYLSAPTYEDEKSTRDEREEDEWDLYR